MGLAVLPARLKSEIAAIKTAIETGADLLSDPETAKHAEWFAAFADKYTFTKDNVEDILKAEIGKTFVRVLCDAGVFKDTAEGEAAFLRFIDSI